MKSISRSALADPNLGLAWSNPDMPPEVLVRKALHHGAFHLLLHAVLEHGAPFVRQQWAVLLSDVDAAPSARARAEVERKLRNIDRGLRLAERQLQAKGLS
jgi:hypothetical protein